MYIDSCRSFEPSTGYLSNFLKTDIQFDMPFLAVEEVGSCSKVLQSLIATQKRAVPIGRLLVSCSSQGYGLLFTYIKESQVWVHEHNKKDREQHVLILFPDIVSSTPFEGIAALFSKL